MGPGVLPLTVKISLKCNLMNAEHFYPRAGITVATVPELKVVGCGIKICTYLL